MKKIRILSLVISCIFVFTALFTGCASETPEETTAPEASTTKAAEETETTKGAEETEETEATETTSDLINGEDLTFGYISPGPDTWYKRDVEGFEYGARKVGAEVIVLNSDYDVEKEIANIDYLINQGVDGMCIFSFNLSGANIAAQKCEAAGIPLVVVDNVGEVLKEEDHVVACIDFDWKAMGQATADWVLENHPGERIAMVTGMWETAPVQHFRSTFEAAIAADGEAEIVAIRDGKYNPEEAVNQSQDLIESGYDFSVLFVGDEDMGAAVMRMLDNKGLLNNPITVISQNGSDAGIPLLEDGSLTYTISTSPGWEGMISFLALYSYVRDVNTEMKQQIMLPMSEVTKENMNEEGVIVPWTEDPVWDILTHEYFPEYDGMY